MDEDFIRVTCACGKRIKADRKFLGRQTTCPACGLKLIVEPTALSKPEPLPKPAPPLPPPIEQKVEREPAKPNRRKYDATGDFWRKPKQPLFAVGGRPPLTEADLGLKPVEPKVSREPFNSGLLVLRVYGALCFLVAVGYCFASNRSFGGEFTQAKDGLIGMLWLTQFTIAGAADVIVTSGSRRRAT